VKLITLKDQFDKIKDNWLIVLLVVLVLLFTLGGNLSYNIANIGTSSLSRISAPGMAMDAAESGYYPPYPGSGNFAPEVEERKIVKTASLAAEVERGMFKDAESKLLDIVSSSGSILLNQNSQGEDKKSYYTGHYTIKVDTTKYDSVVSKLKAIGKVTSFSESQSDVTGSYQDINIELEAEKQRLSRYQKLFDETKDIEQKIQLADRIFNQERTIKYLEDSLKNMDKRIDYSTVTITINEKSSEYTNIIFVKFSELIRGFVQNLNALLKFVFGLVPWIAALLIVYLLVRVVRKRR
jgi:hypothetical protein